MFWPGAPERSSAADRCSRLLSASKQQTTAPARRRIPPRRRRRRRPTAELCKYVYKGLIGRQWRPPHSQVRSNLYFSVCVYLLSSVALWPRRLRGGARAPERTDGAPVRVVCRRETSVVCSCASRGSAVVPPWSCYGHARTPCLSHCSLSLWCVFQRVAMLARLSRVCQASVKRLSGLCHASVRPARLSGRICSCWECEYACVRV